MKAFAMLGIGKTGWIDTPEPVCGPLDAIVKPLALAICSSDVHTIKGAIGDRENLVLGHEGTAEVVEVGSLVKVFKPGDRVILPAITPDWFTLQAQDGFQTHSGGLLNGWKFSNSKNGVFAELIHVNEADANMEFLPDAIPADTGSMLSDMASTGLHGAELAQVRAGDDVAVIGIGPVGLMAVAAAVNSGAAKIFAVGSRPKCIEVAEKFGATHIVNYKNGDILTQIMNATDGRGVDRVILAGGDAPTFIQAIKMLTPGGSLGNINYFDDPEADLQIPIVDWGMGMANKNINGGLMPGGRERMRRLANMTLTGRLHPEELITHRYDGFDKLPEAVEIMTQKPADLIKPVVIVKN